LVSIRTGSKQTRGAESDADARLIEPYRKIGAYDRKQAA
jgi:hypothetical protein